MPVIKIKSNIRNYSVYFGKAKDFLSKLEKTYPNCCYIIDENVWKLYKNRTLYKLDKNKVIILPINEERKYLTAVQEIYDLLIERSAKRNLTMISIGGGIIQDITGFVASTIYRGINWVFIPTTLLAQADSCIGGKTSLNYRSFKNLIGTFYPPSEIFIDPLFLATQKDIDFYSGLGEVVKLHLMQERDNVQKIIKMLPLIIAKEPKTLITAVRNSLLIKQSYIESDEFDTGKRNLLNYGHCFGHAIESVSNFEIPHGQAILVGMILANIVSKQRRLLSEKSESFILQKLLLPSLKVKLKRQFFTADKIIEAMKKDKKRIGQGLALIMMTDNYKTIKMNDITVDEAINALRELMPLLNISV